MNWLHHIGELNNIETLSHLIITNRLKNATVNIKNPFDNSNNISFYISENKKMPRKTDKYWGLMYPKKLINTENWYDKPIAKKRS
mgnify:CR=1 FL=1